MTFSHFLKKLIIALSLFLFPMIAFPQTAKEAHLKANEGFRKAKEKELQQLLDARKRAVERKHPTAVLDEKIAKLRKELAELDPAKDQEAILLRRKLVSYQKIRKQLLKAGALDFHTHQTMRCSRR